MPVGVHVYCIAQTTQNYNTQVCAGNSIFWVTDSRWQQILTSKSGHHEGSFWTLLNGKTRVSVDDVLGRTIYACRSGCLLHCASTTKYQYTDAHRKTHFFEWPTLDDSKFWPIIERIHKSKCNTIALHSICLCLYACDWEWRLRVCTHVYTCMPVCLWGCMSIALRNTNLA